ncbi:MAG: TrmJ/YjtD family RNA methyltransferase [Moraxella sp.]|nr:TrmJ/YjtD family RNA methyltransferase [Moraxella sp.]
MSFLSAIDIVMVETTLPANIGSAARAMHTCQLSQLILVNPKHPIDDTSISHAKGGRHLLDTARFFDDLPSSLSDYALVIAASSRSRHVPRPVITPSELAQLADNFYHTNPTARIALVFGREDRGLTNDELALADYHVQICANPNYSVLNIAASIQVIGSFLYHHYQHTSSTHTTHPTLNLALRSEWDAPAITHAQKTALEQDFITLLTQLELADNDNLKDLPKRLSRLASRLQLDQKEYALIQAAIARIQRQLNK